MGGMGRTLLVSMRRHAYRSSVAPSLHQNLEQLKFVFYQIKSYNYITRLGVEPTKKKSIKE